jgi:hypothetical protein
MNDSKVLRETGKTKTINFHQECDVIGKTNLSRFKAKWEIMEQDTLKNLCNCWNTNISSYLETSGGQSSDPYLNLIHFFNTSVN